MLLIINGSLVANLPWAAAAELAKALASKSKEAEEHAKRDFIISDAAILFRAGAPFGITNRPDIINEMVRKAQFDPKIRRALPGGVKSTAVVGTPSIKKGKPR